MNRSRRVDVTKYFCFFLTPNSREDIAFWKLTNFFFTEIAESRTSSPDALFRIRGMEPNDYDVCYRFDGFCFTSAECRTPSRNRPKVAGVSGTGPTRCVKISRSGERLGSWSDRSLLPAIIYTLLALRCTGCLSTLRRDTGCRGRSR